MRHAIANAHIHSDSDGNCHIDSDSDRDGNCHIHADANVKPDGNVNTYGNSHRHGDRYGSGHSYTYSNSNGDHIAAAFTDATASSDTAAPTVRPADCSLVWELASESREFPQWPQSRCSTRATVHRKSGDSLVAIGRRCALGEAGSATRSRLRI